MSEDYESYINLRQQLSGYKQHINKEQFISKYNQMKNQGSVIYVGIINNEIVATAKLFLEIKFNDNVAQIEDVVVDNNHRRKGYGTKIVDYLVSIVKDKNVYKTVLLTKNNLEKFYTKSGFLLTGINMTNFI